MGLATQLDVYGLRIALHGDWPEVVEDVRLDFAWFETSNGARPPEVELRIERGPPRFDDYGELTARYITPRNVVYQQNGYRIVDYFGRALSVVEGSSVVVQGEERHLVHEAAYQYLLSRIGEHLDLTRRPRLHALGLVGKGGGAVAVMLPSGGGKSTLALRALEADGVKLLSEDTPLIDRRGRLHPFPLRIGINATDAHRVPADHVRRIERMEFHPKLVLELDRFADRIETNPQPLRHIVVGQRSLGTEARLEPLPRRGAGAALLREAVIGVGVYQGMEFVLQRGPRDVMEKAGVLGTRALCCATGLARAQTWRLTLGRDHERNWEALAPLLND